MSSIAALQQQMVDQQGEQLGIPGAIFTPIHDDQSSNIPTHIDIAWTPDKERMLIRVGVETKVVESQGIFGTPKVVIDEQLTWEKIINAAQVLRNHAGID